MPKLLLQHAAASRHHMVNFSGTSLASVAKGGTVLCVRGSARPVLTCCLISPHFLQFMRLFASDGNHGALAWLCVPDFFACRTGAFWRNAWEGREMSKSQTLQNHGSVRAIVVRVLPDCVLCLRKVDSDAMWQALASEDFHRVSCWGPTTSQRTPRKPILQSVF